jgi:hypothetical protein
MSEPTNQERADWAREALDVFGQRTFSKSFTDAMAEAQATDTTCDGYAMLTDLIADLLHLADEHGWDPERVSKSAFDAWACEFIAGDELQVIEAFPPLDQPPLYGDNVVQLAPKQTLFQRVAAVANNAPPPVYYVGHRRDMGCTVTIEQEGAQVRSLSTYYGKVSHSPDGFEWGYEGSGPAQLAFAMVYHATGQDEELAFRTYQQFKRQIVAVLPRDGTPWRITQDQVIDAVTRIDADRARA